MRFRATMVAGLVGGVMLTLPACEGPVGPEGPMGPAGPQGPAGVVTMHVRTATVASDGRASVTFQGLRVESTIVNCWISETSGGPWLKIGTDLEGPTCGAGNSGGNLFVALIGGVPGWVFMATAVTGS